MSEQRTAIVTGAGKRVGRAISEALLADGWTVVAHVRNQSDPVADGALHVAADLAECDCAERIFAATAGLPPVRLLVNNAARFAWDSFSDFDAAEFDAHFAINLRAPLLLTRELSRTHAPGESALVVNLLDSKLAAPNSDFLSYTLSKQALAGFTEVAARTLAASGIRVNAIAPSLMLRSAGQSDENFQAMHSANPLRTGVEPADVVAAIRFLAATPAMTGEVLLLDGGQRFSPPGRDVQFLSVEPQ